MSIRYIYDGKFSGNILVLGRTDCGKTSFVQKLKKRKMDFWNTIKRKQRSRNRIEFFVRHFFFLPERRK